LKQPEARHCHAKCLSRPARGAWIETALGGGKPPGCAVAPRAGRVD